MNIKCRYYSSLSYIFAIVRRTTTSRPVLQLDRRPVLAMGNSKFNKLTVI